MSRTVYEIPDQTGKPAAIARGRICPWTSATICSVWPGIPRRPAIRAWRTWTPA